MCVCVWVCVGVGVCVWVGRCEWVGVSWHERTKSVQYLVHLNWYEGSPSFYVHCATRPEGQPIITVEGCLRMYLVSTVHLPTPADRDSKVRQPTWIQSIRVQ